jgi:hypothetical protein
MSPSPRLPLRAVPITPALSWTLGVKYYYYDIAPFIDKIFLLPPFEYFSFLPQQSDMHEER